MLSLPATAPAVAADAKAGGQGAVRPDLSSANRTAPLAGLPDWSKVGYRGGRALPGDQQLTSRAECRISAEKLASDYGVVADDGKDDTGGLQRAVDDIKSRCSGSAGFEQLSLVSLPAGRIDVTRQISLDANFLVLRGQGSGEGGTRVVFRPDTNTRYDTLSADGGRWEQNTMTHGEGKNAGKGGWIWPGRGLFRVQTRDVADRYKNEWQSAPANRKDLFEGSVNQHWASGVKVRSSPAHPGYSARQGERVLHLDPKAPAGKFTVGGHVWVGAANSLKFYEQQGVGGDEYAARRENLHMRQQVFVVQEVDEKAGTITLDKPLEYDLPVDSTSDGSDPIDGKAFPSKVTPLNMVQGVGLENFSFTQDMSGLPKLGGSSYSLKPEDAVHNYGNLAPEYAMHGIVFKWAADSWARGVKSEMAGSHPIVTEVAKNLQIEGNTFDGAWNKGKGGNGYLRGSRVWDSLYAYNTSRNLRHFTFQWSASNNVALRNDMDSDLNLHGGWERRNLFEGNTVRVPYEHAPGNCSANCGGEGGEQDKGMTWYPIWWAAGPKAVKWSGSSGPQNVFHDNTLLKQTTKGGEFTPFTPYSSAAPGGGGAKVFQFGSDSNDPASFKPLASGGGPIADWGGHETADYLGSGVYARPVAQASLLLGTTAERQWGQEKRMVTWNMQGSGSSADNNTYDSKYNYVANLLRTPGNVLSEGYDVAVLQEAGQEPGSARHVRDIPQTTGHQVRELRVGGDRAASGYNLYWLETDPGAGRVNLAVATRHDVQEVLVVRNNIPTARPALGVRIGRTFYFTAHAFSGSNGNPGGSDAGPLLRAINETMSSAEYRDYAWVVGGDWNQLPRELEARLRNYERAPAVHVMDAGGITRPASQRELDYAVVPSIMQMGIRQLGVLNQMPYSDHLPVGFALHVPDGSGAPNRMPSRSLPTGSFALLNAQTGNVADVQGGSREGGAAILDYGYNGGDNQLWNLAPHPQYRGFYYINNLHSRQHMGQRSGERNGVIVQWNEFSEDQLWLPVERADGTWVFVNHVTRQLLTDFGPGQQLVGHDPIEANGGQQQRWFLVSRDEMNDRQRIQSSGGGQGGVVDIRGGSTADGTPAILYPQNGGDNQEFIRLPAGTVRGRQCYYLLNGNRYLNSTGYGHTPVNTAEINVSHFQMNNDRYRWCEERDGGAGEITLANPTDSGFLYLNGLSYNHQLHLGPVRQHWEWVKTG
ncbi:RICIN domain-containing protein [Streptomyces sp. x-19]|uniref:RICIN domain-containing protein n=1 Tax=Streptomyces sp. x-19 TaxID=2789280 RepID=UPI0039808639